MGELFPTLNNKKKIKNLWRGNARWHLWEHASKLLENKQTTPRVRNFSCGPCDTTQPCCKHFVITISFSLYICSDFFLVKEVHDDILWSQLCVSSLLGQATLLYSLPFSYVWFTSFTLLLSPYTHIYVAFFLNKFDHNYFLNSIIIFRKCINLKWKMLTNTLMILVNSF